MIKYNLESFYPSFSQWHQKTICQLNNDQRLQRLHETVHHIRHKFKLPDQAPEVRYPTQEEIVQYFTQEYKPLFLDPQQLRQEANIKIKLFRNAIYFGQIDNNLRSGLGIALKENLQLYEGNFKNDKKHGIGLEFLKNDYKYFGGYFDGLPNGEGSLKAKEHYIGQWLHGKKHGIGWQQGQRGEIYLGEWEQGKIQGIGIHVYHDIYFGDVHNNLKQGMGIDLFHNGDVYKGQYKEGKPDGNGEYKWGNGAVYKGEFQQGVRHGRGVWQQEAQMGMNIFQGQYVNDKKQGQGIFQYADGIVYTGNFMNDKRHGYGEMIWPDTAFFKGYWMDGLMDGEGIFGFKDTLLRGYWKHNQLQNYERLRISLNNFPMTHHIKEINENEEITSKIAEEPDLASIGDKFRSGIFQSKHESIGVGLDSSQHNRKMASVIQRQFDLLSLMDQRLDINKEGRSMSIATQTNQQQGQLLPKIHTHKQAQTEGIPSYSRGRKQDKFRFDSISNSPNSRETNYTGEKRKNRQQPSARSVQLDANRKNKKQVLLSKKEINIWSIKMNKLKLNPRKYNKLWKPNVVGEIKQLLYPPVWKPPTYYI